MTGIRKRLVSLGSIALMLAVIVSPVQAQVTASDQDRLFRQKTNVLDKRRPPRLDEPREGAAFGAWGGSISLGVPGMREAYVPLAIAAARRHRIPESLFLRLVTQESGWRSDAVSPKGAIGLAQLMPATARSLGVNPNNPSENLYGGARYLREQYDRFGSWRLALAAYNAGPGAVQKYGGVPPFAETQAYVKAILGTG